MAKSTPGSLLLRLIGDRPHRHVERSAGLSVGTLSRATRDLARIDPCSTAFRSLCTELGATVADRRELAVAYGLDPVVAYGEVS